MGEGGGADVGNKIYSVTHFNFEKKHSLSATVRAPWVLIPYASYRGVC